MAFNTGNPVPSSDAKDLSDNAENLDSAVNTVVDTWTDRLGVTRSTLAGQLKKLGYEPPVVYAGLIAFTASDNTKTIDRNGIVYAPLPSELPFTTSGTWVSDDEDKFFVVQGLTNSSSEVVKHHLTLANAVADTSLVNGMSISLSEREAGNGGGAIWDVVLASTVTPNTFNIVQCTGVPTLALVLRDEGISQGTQYGADKTGVNDSTASLSDSNFTQNSLVELSDGLFRMNKWMKDISMQGSGSGTNLEPFSTTTNSGFCLSLSGHATPHGNWDRHYLRDMSIDTGGIGLGNSGCIRFQDEVLSEGADLSSGAWVLENLSLRAENGSCVRSLRGSIGNVYNNIAYHTCEFGHEATNNQISVQHTGASIWNQCHWQRANKAAVYLNDIQDGRGQWVFNDGVMEQNYGFGIFAIGQSGSVNANTVPFVLNNMWFEKNGTEATPPGPSTVTIDSVVYTPKDMRFESFGSIVINGTHVKSMDVVDSDVACYDCRHDGDAGFYSVTKDSDATITLTNPSGGSTFGSVDEWSHTAPASVPAFASNRSPALRMAHRSVHAAATSRTVKSLGLEKTSGSYNLTGSSSISSVQIVGDGLTQDNCVEYTLPANGSWYRNDLALLASGKWTVITIAMKIISGKENIDYARIWDFSSTISGNIRQGAVDEWVTTVMLLDNRTTGDPDQYYSIGTTSGGGAVVRFADYQVAQFDTKQEASDFIHSGIFEYTP